MSVIGRLDGQVERVLIEPLSKKRAPERDSDGAQRSGDTHVAPVAANETVPAESEAGRSEEAQQARDLPVWLL